MNLLEQAESQGVDKSLIYNFIDKGGAEFINRMFIEYMILEMQNKKFMDGFTPTGAVSHSREIVGTIFNDFREQFDEQNPE